MVLHGEIVVLRTPQPREYDLLTSLRNKHRHWFFDDAEVSLEDGRRWLASRTEDNCLLAVEAHGAVVGTIGWSRDKGAAELGRVILDYDLTRKADIAPAGLAQDAFDTALAHLLRTGPVWCGVKPGNHSSSRLMRRAGLRRVPGEPGVETWASAENVAA
jgi:RimJ/RimL family protein N-acetyltransferase